MTLGPAQQLVSATGTQARVLRRCWNALRLRNSANRGQSAPVSLFSGPGWDPVWTRLGPGPTGSAHRCSHFGTVPRTALCPINAVPRPCERFERARWTPAARQVPRGHRSTSIWHPCGPGSRPGPARVPPEPRPGPTWVPVGSQPGPARVPTGSSVERRRNLSVTARKLSEAGENALERPGNSLGRPAKLSGAGKNSVERPDKRSGAGQDPVEGPEKLSGAARKFSGARKKLSGAVRKTQWGGVGGNPWRKRWHCNSVGTNPTEFGRRGLRAALP